VGLRYSHQRIQLIGGLKEGGRGEKLLSENGRGKRGTKGKRLVLAAERVIAFTGGAVLTLQGRRREVGGGGRTHNMKERGAGSRGKEKTYNVLAPKGAEISAAGRRASKQRGGGSLNSVTGVSESLGQQRIRELKALQTWRGP